MCQNKGKKTGEGQLQHGISTRQSKGTQKPYHLPCFKDPPEKKGETLEWGYSEVSFPLCSKAGPVLTRERIVFQVLKREHVTAESDVNE